MQLSNTLFWTASLGLLIFSESRGPCDDSGMKPIPLQSTLQSVQPMTGIVLWSTNEAVASTPIQLEYSYFTYAKVVAEKGEYNWSSLDRLLDQVAGRGHQAIIRFHDTYVGAKTGVPKYITELAGYETTKAKSEGKDTEFPDWSHPELRRFAIAIRKVCSAWTHDLARIDWQRFAMTGSAIKSACEYNSVLLAVETSP